MKPFTRTFFSFATLTALATGPASAGVFGSLANFDAINDTGVIARGFEIELHGITKSEISDVFGLNRNSAHPLLATSSATVCRPSAICTMAQAR